MTLSELTLTDIVTGLATKRFSSLELTQAYLAASQHLQPTLNVFITLCEETAIQQAKTADQSRGSGKAHALAGIPIAHKDMFCTQGIRTSCGSRMLDNFIPPYDSTVIAKCNSAQLVNLGKTNCDEFAMGSSNENSYYGPVYNPWDLARVPGGSSGGSAAAVAARLCVAATGTDTGGSIRQPAALCGITGLKPTYGRVSRHGMVAFASSLDQAGIFTQTAQDAAILLSIIAGFDPLDSTAIDHPVDHYQEHLHHRLDGLRIGLPKEYFTEGIDSGVEARIQDALKELEKLGAKLQVVSLPHTEYAVPTYYVIASAEAASNLSRYDGVRYGHRCQDPQNLDDLYQRSRGQAFGAEVKRRILIGTYALSAGYYDAYYLKAQRVRRLIRDDFMKAFTEVDVIACPTTPSTAFKIGAKNQDPVNMYLSDIYTIAVNLAGLPGISIPVGLHQGLPVGLQLIGNFFNEAKILNVAHQLQTATDWHQQCPPIHA